MIWFQHNCGLIEGFACGDATTPEPPFSFARWQQHQPGGSPPAVPAPTLPTPVSTVHPRTLQSEMKASVI